MTKIKKKGTKKNLVKFSEIILYPIFPIASLKKSNKKKSLKKVV